MFSCCRANPKNAKASKKDSKSTKKSDDKSAEDDGQQSEEHKKQQQHDKKLIIPTITIENGKSNDNDNDDYAIKATKPTKPTTTTTTTTTSTTSTSAPVESETKASGQAAGNDDDGDNAADDDDVAKPTNQSNGVKNDATQRCNDDTIAERQASTEAEAVDATSDNAERPATGALEIATNNDLSSTTVLSNVEQPRQDTAADVAAASSAEDAATSTTTTTTPSGHQEQRYQEPLEQRDQEQLEQRHQEQLEQRHQEQLEQLQQQQEQPQRAQKQGKPHHDAHEPPAKPSKSCLSRHNSTHTSIKKKVNISAHAEIIEPDPLPPPPAQLGDQRAGSLADDDDVFSDSLPPPKRESMCAPYIVRDDASEPDLLAFAHGLPDWFNDERINDIGCIEPPVTPVGRDELELKRQRLYTDLLRAAHAAVEHSVRFTPLGTDAHHHHQPYSHAALNGGTDDVCCLRIAGRGGGGGGGDCDPDLKPSIADNLEHLVNRLEKLVERLERSVSARDLEIANRTFDTVLERKRESFDLETTDLPPLPPPVDVDSLSQQADNLNQRIGRIESSLSRINDRHSSSLSTSYSNGIVVREENAGSLDNIPTVLEDYQVQQDSSGKATETGAQEDDEEESFQLLPPPPSMSVLGYQDIVSGPLSQFLAQSTLIGGDVAKQAELVKKAFDAQLQFVTLATQCAKPSQDKQMELLKPTSMQISAIQDFREKNRASPFFNHLSAISESIPALGWVCVAPTPGPHVKEMNDAGQFYTNRVLKEWKEKGAKHVEWARSWVQTLTELQAYIKQYHTTGLVWSGKGSPPASGAAPPPPPIGMCPAPPPPPAFDLASMSLDGHERNALFAEINQGEAITKNLKKVTGDMQTHKNPSLRTGPAPFKTPTQFGGVAASSAPVIKEPVFTRDGKKWLIEHQKNNAGLVVENAEMNNVVYVFKCEGSTVTVKGKVNNIVFDSCKKCSLLFDSVVASIEFVNCQSVQMQVLGFVPTVIIDKSDGVQMYLSQGSLGVEIVNSKSSEMNVMLPAASGDYTELALPEQYKTTISGKTLKTVCVDSLG